MNYEASFYKEVKMISMKLLVNFSLLIIIEKCGAVQLCI